MNDALAPPSQMTPTEPASAPPEKRHHPSAAHSPLMRGLAAKLAAVRTKYQRITAATGGAVLLMTFVALLFVEMLLDWSLGFPRPVRALLLLADVALLAFFFWRNILNPIR